MLNHETKALICEYEVEIECLHDSKEIDIMERFLTFKESIPAPMAKSDAKEKKLAKWVLEEGTAVKSFLIRLHQAHCNLDILKAKTPKATYYRNLKICQEKGFILNGKLVRKIYD